MRIVPFLIMIMALTGCGKCHDSVVTGTAQPPASSDVQKLVDDENNYRLGQGQTALTSGLSCSVQQISSGTWLSSSSSSPGYPGSGLIALTGTSYSYLFRSVFNEASNNGVEVLIPTAIRPLFDGLNYKISCSGHVVVTADGYYGFSLNSDDGSILTIDGAQVINNDGAHGMTLKNGTKFLRKGAHTISLLYSQSGSGPHGLVLLMDGSDVPAANFYH